MVRQWRESFAFCILLPRRETGSFGLIFDPASDGILASKKPVSLPCGEALHGDLPARRYEYHILTSDLHTKVGLVG